MYTEDTPRESSNLEITEKDPVLRWLYPFVSLWSIHADRSVVTTAY